MGFLETRLSKKLDTRTCLVPKYFKKPLPEPARGSENYYPTHHYYLTYYLKYYIFSFLPTVP